MAIADLQPLIAQFVRIGRHNHVSKGCTLSTNANRNGHIPRSWPGVVRHLCPIPVFAKSETSCACSSVGKRHRRSGVRRANVPAARVPTVVATITELKRLGCETTFGRTPQQFY